MSTPTRYLAILGSSRSFGHTREILELITRGRDIDFIDLSSYRILPYSYSHEYLNDDFALIVERLLRADVIVFATPVYWYAMSAQMKLLFDRFTDLVRVHRELRGTLLGKVCFGIATSESDRLPSGFSVPFSETCNYLGMHWGGCFHARYLAEFVLEPKVYFAAKRFARILFMEESTVS